MTCKSVQVQQRDGRVFVQVGDVRIELLFGVGKRAYR